jgi:hypothetical protein
MLTRFARPALLRTARYNTRPIIWRQPLHTSLALRTPTLTLRDHSRDDESDSGSNDGKDLNKLPEHAVISTFDLFSIGASNPDQSGFAQKR